MTNDEIQLLLEYIELLEVELNAANPERFFQIVEKREGLLPLLQKQREVIGSLQNTLQDYQAQITQLRAELVSLKSQQKDPKAERQDRPNAHRKS